MKEVSLRIEPCDECDGDGYHVSGHNGNHDQCYDCKGTGKQPAGTKKWKAEREKVEEAIMDKAEKEIEKKLKAVEQDYLSGLDLDWSHWIDGSCSFVGMADEMLALGTS